HILSQADHRLNYVEPWAETRLHTLRGCTGQPLHPLDVSDDRLARVLHALSDDARWSTFESALTQQLVRVYALRPARVRLDSTTGQGLLGGDARRHVPVWTQQRSSPRFAAGEGHVVDLGSAGVASGDHGRAWASRR